MREILFKAKRAMGGEWIYGNLLKTDDGTFVIQNYAPFEGIGKYMVAPETICQYTGLTDRTKWEELSGKERQKFLFEWNYEEERKNQKEDWKGRKIWENDIVETPYRRFVVVYADGVWGDRDGIAMRESIFGEGGAVIGNIFDNPELLKDGG